MAFKINKADQKRIADTITKFNDKKAALQAALDDLNETRDELRGIVEDIKDEMQGEYDDKSEKWLEGDRAEPTQSWIEALGDVVTTFEDEIEMPDMSEIDEKIEEGVPSEPDY